MKIRFASTLFSSSVLLAAAFFLFPANSRGQTSISLNVNYNTFPPSYYIQVPISTSNTIQSSYEVISPNTNFEATYSPINGQANYTFTNITDFNDFANAITNGTWQFITDVATHAQHIYYFHVTATGFNSNAMPQFEITNPMDGDADVSSNITFTWDNNPVNYTLLNVFAFNDDFSYEQGADLNAATDTSWTPPVPLTDSDTNYTFSVTYQTSAASYFTISTPTDTNGVQIPNWSSTSQLGLGESVLFTLPPLPPPIPSFPNGGHVLVAHFTFDNTNDLGQDSSGNGNDYNSGGGQNGATVNSTSDAEVGGGALQFNRNDSDYFSAGFQGWDPTPPAQILSTLAGSYSIAVWVKTTASIGSPGAPGYQGSAVIGADVSGGAFDQVPIALAGGTVTFETGQGNINLPDQTISTTNTVNDGNYHQIIVTRNQNTGLKNIYIDGHLQASGYGTTHPLSDPKSIVIGAVNDAGGDFRSSAFYAGYDGKMDDLQIYGGVLNETEVLALFNSPGTTSPNQSGNGLVFHYTFDNTNDLGQDSSGNGYDLTYNGDPQGDGVTFTNDAKTGAGAAYFDGGSFFSYLSTPTNVLHTFASDFTLSFWIKTTQNIGSPNDPAFYDVDIVSLDLPGGAEDLIPAGLSGGAISFNTGGSDEESLNSQGLVADGNYHHVVITRAQATGAKQIYIDGVLDNSDFATTDLLNAPQLLSIGSDVDATRSDPANANTSLYFLGELDDIQLYSRVLSSSEVTSLFQNPGSVAGGPASAGLIAHYNFDNSNNLGQDTSGNGYDLNYNGDPQGEGVAQDVNTIAGAGSAYFDGGSFLSYSNTPTAVLAAFSTSFTLSFWVNTTQTFGNNGEEAYAGAGIVAADVPGQANDLVPAALTGGEIGFNTGPDDDTINTTVNVNDGHYHHIVVTRDQPSGAKQIYVDGVLNVSDFDSTNVLSDPETLAVGAQIDASGPDPSMQSTADYFQGLLDDIQIYSRVLNTNEIAYLYANPGSTLVGASNPPTLAPVSVNFEIDLFRQHNSSSGDTYIAFPGINNISPIPITTNLISSPTGKLTTYTTNSSSQSSSSEDYQTLAELEQEITNGQWTLTVNQGNPSQQIFHFTVSLANVNFNTLTPVIIYAPTNGGLNVPTNTPFQWSGPADFESLAVNTQTSDGTGYTSANFATTVTNWPSPPTIPPGTNTFYVEYDSNNVSGAAISVPITATMVSVSNWVTALNLRSTAQSQFTVTANAAPAPVHIVDVTQFNNNFQFSFFTTTGHSNIVQTTTNLAPPITWTNVTSVPGDGSLKTVTVPTITSPQQYFRVITQ